MSKLRADSNVEWEKWGEIDPLWAVAAWEGKQKSGISPWTDEEFYEVGLMDWQDFVRHWEKYGLDNTSCLEIGCGAGRLTMHLAKYFRIVHALDVSREMLAYAREHIGDSSIIFYLSNGVEIPLSENSVSAAFSTHVFQHFDRLSQATSYFAEISRVLIPGGSLMIHLPIYNWPAESAFIFKRIYRIQKCVEGISVWFRRPLVARGLQSPIMRLLSYPVDYFHTILPEKGFTDIEILIFPVKSNWSLHPFVLARKTGKS